MLVCMLDYMIQPILSIGLFLSLICILLLMLCGMYSMIFRWLAIPWIQKELDSWRNKFNSTKRRNSRHKILPQEIPDLVHHKPGHYGHKNFMVRLLHTYFLLRVDIYIQIHVEDDILDDVEAKWCPSDNPVFLLVPPEFELVAEGVYAEVGRPDVTSQSFWLVYSQMLHRCKELDNTSSIAFMDALEADAFRVEVEFLAGQKPFQESDSLVGTQSDDIEEEDEVVDDLLGTSSDQENAVLNPIIAVFEDVNQYIPALDVSDDDE